MNSPSASPPSRDFHRLRDEGHTQSAGKLVGLAFTTTRDRLARGLSRLGVTPNMLSIAGATFTAVAAACLLLGGSHTHASARADGVPPYPLLAFVALFAAFGCDMLDGAVARIARLHTPFGAVLDSSLDRLGDLMIYLALIAHFAQRGNVTYTLLAAVALSNAFLISYVKARAETLIPTCEVGYWLRGERCAALWAAAFSAHVPAVLWQQALLPALTVVRRLVWTHRTLVAAAAGRPPPSNVPSPGPRGLLRPWRYPRGSIPYDVVTGLNLLFIFTGPWLHPIFGPAADPLGALLRTVT